MSQRIVINNDGDSVEPFVIGLAELVVKDIFEQAEGCQRIQLMGGTYPDMETGLGGFNQGALVNFVAKSIDRNLRGAPFMSTKNQ